MKSSDVFSVSENVLSFTFTIGDLRLKRSPISFEIQKLG